MTTIGGVTGVGLSVPNEEAGIVGLADPPCVSGAAGAVPREETIGRAAVGGLGTGFEQLDEN